MKNAVLQFIWSKNLVISAWLYKKIISFMKQFGFSKAYFWMDWSSAIWVGYFLGGKIKNDSSMNR